MEFRLVQADLGGRHLAGGEGLARSVQLQAAAQVVAAQPVIGGIRGQAVGEARQPPFEIVQPGLGGGHGATVLGLVLLEGVERQGLDLDGEGADAVGGMEVEERAARPRQLQLHRLGAADGDGQEGIGRVGDLALHPAQALPRRIDLGDRQRFPESDGDSVARDRQRQQGDEDSGPAPPRSRPRDLLAE